MFYFGSTAVSACLFSAAVTACTNDDAAFYPPPPRKPRAWRRRRPWRVVCVRRGPRELLLSPPVVDFFGGARETTWHDGSPTMITRAKHLHARPLLVLGRGETEAATKNKT
ncbi:unnamed protein product [Ectocarpus sp. 13 AM-2016]